MNLKLIVIILVVIETLYHLVLNRVSYRSANNPTPDNLKDVYDAEAYAKWKSYKAESCRLSLFSSLTSSAIALLLLCFNVHAAFASLFPKGAFMQLLSVIILEVAVTTLTGLVFSYIVTFKLEEKYGFNRSTKKTFALDKSEVFLIVPLFHSRVYHFYIVLNALTVHNRLPKHLMKICKPCHNLLLSRFA